MTDRGERKSALWALVTEGDALRIPHGDLAEALGISQQRIWQILREVRGPRPRLSHFPDFADRCARVKQN